MFGFLAPRQKIPKWRQSYARVCQHQRLLFGLTSLPFLSYEATFLYQLGIDFKLIAELPECAPTCCRLRRIGTSDDRQDMSAALFASAFGMMLAGVKLDDDVNDSGRWFNRLAKWKYCKAVATSHQVLDGLSDGLPVRIRSAIEAHASLEAAGCDDLEAYCQPTAGGFGAMFRSFAAAEFSKQNDDGVEVFAEIGRHLGAAIIAWDCAVDFQKDLIKGEYNPLANDVDVRRSFDYCLLQLAQIGWLLPEGSTCVAVIASVSDRVRQRRNANIEHPVKTLERWGFLRQKGRAYAKCDGCDALCMVGDCCECLGGGAEAAGGCAECGMGNGVGFPCCDAIFCCSDDPCGGKTKNKTSMQNENSTSDEPSAFAWCHGKERIVDDTLNPGGFVSIDGERIIAKSASGKMIVSGTHCKVVGTDPFGVTVAPL